MALTIGQSITLHLWMQTLVQSAVHLALVLTQDHLVLRPLLMQLLKVLKHLQYQYEQLVQVARLLQPAALFLLMIPV
jgi:hypothetical protein